MEHSGQQGGSQAQRRDGAVELPPAPDGLLLGKWLKEQTGLSWTRAYAQIESGKVSVNGRVSTDRALRLMPGDRCLWEPNRSRKAEVLPETGIDASVILYWDPHLVVVNKPAGVLSVPYEEHDPDSLIEQLGRLMRRIDPTPAMRRSKMGTVHRLDKDTTGVMVFSRTWAANDCLGRQFRDHSTERRYLAMAHGQVRSRRIESHLVRDRGDGFRGSIEEMARPQRNPGMLRHSVTHVECLESFADCCLIACRLETGRTHQIRIHLSEAGHPLVGESAYLKGYAGVVLEAPRILLHAESLGFRHPNGKWMRWQVPLPQDFSLFLEGRRGTNAGPQQGTNPQQASIQRA
jgi:23S rRNA pseudouridine1911/1915/1917 synthase